MLYNKLKYFKFKLFSSKNFLIRTIFYNLLNLLNKKSIFKNMN